MTSFIVTRTVLLFVCAGLAAPAVSHAQLQGRPTVALSHTDNQSVNSALDRGLKYLASKQKPDGNWHTPAIDSLTLLAFLGRGHVPGRGPHADVLEKGTAALLSKQKDSGYFGDEGYMYAHGLSTLACSELYGMATNPALGDRLQKAVRLIETSQVPHPKGGGGWRNYRGNQGVDCDLSVTVMQVVALRAANNAGIAVKKKVLDNAATYITNLAVSPSAKGPGGYAYQDPNAGATPQTTAAGIVSLQLLGHPDHGSIAPALAFVNAVDPVRNDLYFYYFHYYAMQAQYQAGGTSWDKWHPKVLRVVLDLQEGDGSWVLPKNNTIYEAEATVGPDRLYYTAMACLILEVYKHFLPAYQR